MTTPRLLVVDDPLFDEHVARSYHPERPERLGAARRAVNRAAVPGGPTVQRLEPRDATLDEITLAHEDEYVHDLAALDGQRAAIDAETYVAPASVRAARRAAGGAMALVDALLAAPPGSARGVALLRPPGHHATRARAMGFCLINNAAVAAAHALARGARKVAVVDWDVHHGNGTQDIFWDDPRVLYVSLHQSPLYPGTGARDEAGAGEGTGYTLNVPLAPGAGPAVYGAAFEQVVLPVLDLYGPDLLLVSAGYDAHERDPLAQMRLDDGAYRAMAASLARVADRSAGGRMALLLEGGYDLTAIEGSLLASLEGMLAPEAPNPEAALEIGARHASEIVAAREGAGRYWRMG